MACGSPFSPVKYGGRTIPIAQCNNVYIFPAIGLAVAASGAKRVTDCMMLAGARALAEHSPALRDPTAPLLPALRDLREIAIEIAVEAALEADPVLAESGCARWCGRAVGNRLIRRSRLKGGCSEDWLPHINRGLERPRFGSGR